MTATDTGSVTVKIVPDTDDFHRAVTAALSTEQRSLPHLEVTLALDGGGGTALRTLTDAMHDLTTAMNHARTAAGTVQSGLSQFDTTSGLLDVLNQFSGLASNLIDIRDKSSAASDALGETAGQAEAAGGRMSASGIAVAGAGIALADFTSQALDAAGAGKELSTVLSMASTGASVGMIFGPEGAAIGGAAGAAVGLLVDAFSGGESAAKKYADEMNSIRLNAIQDTVDELTNTIDSNTQAFTKNSRESLAAKITKDNPNVFDEARKYGVNQRTLIDGVLGEPQDQAKLNTALGEMESRIARLKEMLIEYSDETDPRVYGSSKFKKDQDDAEAELEALEKTKNAISGYVTSSEQAKEAAKQRSLEIDGYIGKLKGLPRDVKTTIKAQNLDGTLSGLEKLISANGWLLSNSELKIMLRAEGLPSTKADVKKLKADLGWLNGAYVTPQVSAADKASPVIKRIKRQMDAIKSKSVRVTAYYVNQINGENKREGMRSAGVIPRTATDSSVSPRSDASKNGAKNEAQQVVVTPTIHLDSLKPVDVAVNMHVALGTFDTSALAASSTWADGLQAQFDAVSSAGADAISQLQDAKAGSRDAVNDAKQALAAAKQTKGNKDDKKAQKQLDQAKAALKAGKAALAAARANNASWQEGIATLDQGLQKYQEVNDALQAAVSNLDAVKQAQQSYKDSLSASYQSWGSLLNSPVASASGILKSLTTSANKLDEFKAGMTQLTQMKLPQKMLDQLAQAGPDSLAYVQALLKATPDQYAAIVEQWSKIETSSTSAAGTIGDYEYADEIAKAGNAVQGYLATLQAMSGPLQDANSTLMNNIANNVAANTTSIQDDLARATAAYDDWMATIAKNNALIDAMTAGVPATATSATSSAQVSSFTTINVYGTTTGNTEADMFATGTRLRAVIGA